VAGGDSTGGVGGGSDGTLYAEGTGDSVVDPVGGVIFGGLFLLLIIPITANITANPKIPNPAQSARLCKLTPGFEFTEAGIAEADDEGSGVNSVNVTTVGVDEAFNVGAGVLGFAVGDGVGLALQPQVRSVLQSGFLQ